jgi:hypothetical protein
MYVTSVADNRQATPLNVGYFEMDISVLISYEFMHGTINSQSSTSGI